MYLRAFRIILTCLTMLLSGALAAQKSFTLVLDAGHGGKDAGAVGAFSYEKNINLNVALAVGKLVEQHCPDVRVIYTRKTDVFIPLGDRPNIANKAKADLFISIHTNSAGSNHGPHGAETYTLCLERMNVNLEFAKRENSVITYESDYKTRYEGFDPNSAESYVIFQFMQNNYMKQSVELAKYIQGQYTSHGRKNKGVKQANLLVLRNTTMPAVLTELGFITNPDEERFLNSREGINTLATSIFNGFLAYRKAHGARNVPAPLKVETPQQPTQQAATIEETRPEPTPAQPSQTSQQQSRPARQQTPTAQSQSQTTQQQTQTAQPQQSSQTTYKVQFSMGNKPANPNDSRYRGFPAVTSELHGGAYKYYMGEYSTLSEARQALKTIRNTFTDAFIVKFQDGRRVQ